jgi:hypothetical protein
MDDKEIPVVAGMTFNNCTILIHVGQVEDFRDIIQEFVAEGIISPVVAKQLLGDEDATSE